MQASIFPASSCAGHALFLHRRECITLVEALREAPASSTPRMRQFIHETNFEGADAAT
jgi:hypothetical protein